MKNKNKPTAAMPAVCEKEFILRTCLRDELQRGTIGLPLLNRGIAKRVKFAQGFSIEFAQGLGFPGGKTRLGVRFGN